MLLILGMDADRGGDWTVRDLDNPRIDLRNDEPTYPRVYWSASLWPEIETLCTFDAERQRLKLPKLTDAPWH